MKTRRLRLLLLVGALAAMHAQVLFEGASGMGEEQLKGKPKIVKVDREKPGSDTVLPEEESTYREDGKISTHQRFVDGKLVADERYEYDAQGGRASITTRNGDGKIAHIQTFHMLADGTEQEIDVADGKELSRTVRRFDANQRVTELRQNDGETSMIVHFEYDDRGRPSEARLRVEGGNAFKVQNGPNGEHHVEKIAEGDMLRVRVVYAGDDQALITVYDFDGDIMLQLQSTETSIGSRMQQVLFQWEPQGKPATASSERVDKADDHGNWTLKTLFERDPRTQVDEAVGRLHRTIVYY